jgi:hypothetical protein
MEPFAILLPMVALAALTFLVLLIMPFKRIGAVLDRRINPGDFRLGESERVPPDVALPNRNYMNLLELPVLFYVVCLALFLTKSADHVAVALAWIYVGLRVVHSLVHLTYNNVLHRLVAFAASAVILAALWVKLFLAVYK